MKKEDILNLAQNGKDEREQAIIVSSLKLGGSVATLFAGLLCILVMTDGYLLETIKSYDFKTVAAMLFASETLSLFVSTGYQVIRLKKLEDMFTFILMGALFFGSLSYIVSFYLS